MKAAVLALVVLLSAGCSPSTMDKMVGVAGKVAEIHDKIAAAEAVLEELDALKRLVESCRQTQDDLELEEASVNRLQSLATARAASLIVLQDKVDELTEELAVCVENG